MTDEILHEKTWTWLRKGSLKSETESLLKPAQSKDIRINYIKAKWIRRRKEKKKLCWLCGDRDKTIIT